jgi:catechol 2,3-dioxygenase-like lactoylglutathione lyase family enzyme
MTRPTTQAISPSFIVSNVERTIAFYRDKLGFETRFQQPERNPFFAISPRKISRHCRTPSVIAT